MQAAEGDVKMEDAPAEADAIVKTPEAIKPEPKAEAAAEAEPEVCTL